MVKKDFLDDVVSVVKMEEIPPELIPALSSRVSEMPANLKPQTINYGLSSKCSNICTNHLAVKSFITAIVVTSQLI